LIIITRSRGTGKTTDLIKISAEKQIPILAPTRGQKELIKEMAKKLGFEIPDPFSFGESFRGSTIKQVLVDNAEMVLQILISKEFGVDLDIAGLTMTKQVDIKKKEIAEKFDLFECDINIVD
jgi:gamma-glutamyl-gamma-aminobutyrate hydrolase PuuD